MKRAFKTKPFVRWMQKTELTEDLLKNAVKEMSEGLVNADLGGGLIKKRIALPGRGKRGGVRTIIATNKDDRWFFLHGFEKADKSNISQLDEDALKLIGSKFLRMDDASLATAIIDGELWEITL
ncbi:MAG: type II toxin-antitoxin system RelE/ParE family toxin [Desulfovibrio sp.]|jgi:hypothetical protein|nr:type II toxin-antitoxin system RelE/ParE family toxin [Desulfovibrio sp.]